MLSLFYGLIKTSTVKVRQIKVIVLIQEALIYLCFFLDVQRIVRCITFSSVLAYEEENRTSLTQVDLSKN